MPPEESRMIVDGFDRAGAVDAPFIVARFPREERGQSDIRLFLNHEWLNDW